MNKINLKGVSSEVWVRTIMTIIFGANVVLGYLGINLIPVTEGEVGLVVEAIIAAATAFVMVWSWWKNNSLTVAAQQSDAERKERAIGAEFIVEPAEIDPDAMGFMGTEGLPENFEFKGEEAN